MIAGYMSEEDASQISRAAERDMAGREYGVQTEVVLRHVNRTGHSSYDCEFVALAQGLGVRLVTGDRKLAEIFPEFATTLEEFV